MAAATANGCVEFIDKNIPKQYKCPDIKESLVNGINNHKNGFHRSEHLTNGDIKRRLENGSSNSGSGAEGRPVYRVKMERGSFREEDLYRGSFEKCSLLTAALTNLGLYILMFLGFINQLLFTPKAATEKNREGYAPLYEPFEVFYSRNVYRRVKHCFNQPVCSAPGAHITLKERASPDNNWTFGWTGREVRCVNLGSYNYLGFAGDEGGEGGEEGSSTLPAVEAGVRRYGLAACSARAELGSTPLLADLERELAAFLGVEEAVVFGMGFATNALQLPALLTARTLALSDENNHASLILGLRLSAATVRVFRHNDVRHAELLALQALAEGRWDKIVIVVEGVYSMEGSVCPLRALVELKKRLGLYLYLDEAHSIGAMGATGRGVTEHAGVDPRDVDVLMGTFTKSFASAGGYVAGGAELARLVRGAGHAHRYAHAMPAPVAAQVLAALTVIRSPAGAARIARLRENTRYFRSQTARLGVVALGARDSPVVPLLVYSFSKMEGTVRALAARRLAAVGVGFPATPLAAARIRLCLSAAHTRRHLDDTLAALADLADELGLRYSRTPTLQ